MFAGGAIFNDSLPNCEEYSWILVGFRITNYLVEGGCNSEATVEFITSLSAFSRSLI
jgi:hypothetical protein